MKKKYYLTEKTTLQDLQKLGFGVSKICSFACDDSRNLYIALDGNLTRYEARRIYHNTGDQMVKASEIADLIGAGVVKL